MSAKAVGIILAALLFGAIGWRQLQQWRRGSTQASAELLSTLAADANRKLPANPAPDVVVYRAELKEGMLTYSLRIERSDANNLSPEEVATIRRRVTAIVCEDAEASRARDAGGSVRANIADRTGTPISTIAVLPNGC